TTRAPTNSAGAAAGVLTDASSRFRSDPTQRPYRRRNPAGSPRHRCTATGTTCVRDAVFRAGGIAGRDHTGERSNVVARGDLRRDPLPQRRGGRRHGGGPGRGGNAALGPRG